MKLRLIQTGGFAGLTRSAEIDVEPEEAEALVRCLPAAAASRTPRDERDAFNHVLVVDDRRIPFSPEDAPAECKPTIDRLMSMLAFDPAGRSE